MHVLITGGAGFIGSNLVAYHINKGDKVHVIDDLSTGRIENISLFLEHLNFKFDEVDILVWKELEKAVAWADRIYHLAAVVGVFRVLKEPISVLATNIAGCERLLRVVHSTDWNTKLIIASSSEVYGNRFEYELLSEDMELHISPGHNSRWNYSISKLADEAFALSYARQYNIDVTVVRFFNIIGPNQTGKYGMVVPRFVHQAVRAEDITIYGDGTQQRAFLDVRDAIIYLDLLSNNPLSRAEVINVGTAREITINQLAYLTKEFAQSSSNITYTSYEDAYGKDFDEIYHRKPNLEKLLRLTNHSPKWTLEETLTDLIQREQTKEL
ncbi:MAG: NAD-dependent epimerase/dehydratase family protein [Thiovulaceae bacterium]|nr:NAD-dependent epimerase/dehydratase family protein [Sulfurimonadaceae bacterium]